MPQLLYISSSDPRGVPIDLAALLAQSQRNNARAGVSGLLYSDARRFLQVLEGAADQVEAIFARIQVDPRHRALVLLSRRGIAAREFGDWSMAMRQPGDSHDAFAKRVEAMLVDAAPSVRGTFAGLIDVRRAA